MRKHSVLLLVLIMVLSCSCSQERHREIPGNFVFVEGGTFVNTKSNLYGKNVNISDFYICKNEVTQKEWKEVMESNPSQFKDDALPVEMVSWYDSIEYCNKRSLKEGLAPYYDIDKDKKDTNNTNENDNIKWTIKINKEANGYRLPTEVEWEYAAGGGQLSKSYTYSGSNDVNEVAWYWKNSGDKTLSGDWFWPNIESNKNKTKPTGTKKPNELGIYDMSGNVREWCWDWYGDVINSKSGSVRVWRGGCWLADEKACEASYRGNFEAYSKGFDQGFRVCLNG